MSSRFSDRQNHFLHLLISTKKKKAACFNKSLKNQHFKYELLFFVEVSALGQVTSGTILMGFV